MKKILNTPIFYMPQKYFTGDNVAHYLPAKYLWHLCNQEKKAFYQLVYNFELKEKVQIDFAFYKEQPQHLYFKKPEWINEWVLIEDLKETNSIAQNYDFFINNYRYRGAPKPEKNLGYSEDLNVIELYVPAYSYKYIYEHGLYLDDLELNDKYAEFVKQVDQEINPDRRAVIALHQRGEDPWNRHLPKTSQKYEELLFNLVEKYPEHQIVLLGEGWKYYQHPRIGYLEKHINRKQIQKKLKEYSACLQYILAVYFCRSVDLVFIGISGFSLFLESIRPLNLKPPIPVFWGKQTFSGTDTCLEKLNFRCPEFEAYQKQHPEDHAFQHQVHHFIYYSRDEDLLLPYCNDYPNDLSKILNFLDKLEKKQGLQKEQSRTTKQKTFVTTTDKELFDLHLLQKFYIAAINLKRLVFRKAKTYFSKIKAYPSEKCVDCSVFEDCAGGCPLLWTVYQPSNLITGWAE